MDKPWDKSVEWETPMFDGDNTARAKLKTNMGTVVIDFDEREERKVEIMISGDHMGFAALEGINQVVNEYKEKHPHVQLRIPPVNNNAKFVNRYLGKSLN